MATTITTTTDTTPNTSFGYNDSQVSTGLKILMSQNGTVASIVANLYKVGTPTGTLKCGLQADSGGVPSNTFLDFGSVSIASLGAGSGNKADVTFTFAAPITVSNGTNYWAVLTPDNTRDATNYIVATGSTSGTYNGGIEKLSDNVGNWVDDAGYDRFVLTIDDVVTASSRSTALNLLGVGS